LLRAIELNGAAVKLNHRAFLWGRILAARPDLIGQILGGSEAGPQSVSDPATDLDTMIDNRAKVLTAYQSRRLAARYRRLVDEVKEREVAVFGKAGRLSLAAAEGWFRVLSAKDEYEVARLHAAAQYGAKPVFYMAPPLITSTDHATGRRRKIAIPGWLALPLFHVLRHGKALRGTRFDPFGYQEDRKAERAMIDAYTEDMRQVLATLSPGTLDAAVELAQIPDKVRGFGPIKLDVWDRLQERRQHLLQRLTSPTPTPAVAAE
jgi:indolepyruvate ferredoxin oxidoreductase